MIVEIANAKPNQYSYTTSEITPHAVQFSADVSARITALGGPNPKVLNLYSASITGAFPGEVHLNDPFLYALLWQAGKLDPERVFAAIRERTYDLVIVPPDMLSGVYNTPPDMLRPLRRNYAFAERIPMFDRAFDVLVRRRDAK